MLTDAYACHLSVQKAESLRFECRSAQRRLRGFKLSTASACRCHWTTVDVLAPVKHGDVGPEHVVVCQTDTTNTCVRNGTGGNISLNDSTK